MRSISADAFSCITSVEAKEALVAEDLLGAVEAVLVHQLPDQGAGGALVLHARLDQVDGVDGGGPGGWGNSGSLFQSKIYQRSQGLRQKTTRNHC